MHYCRGLSFTQDPDYGFIIGLFEGCMKKNGIDPSFMKETFGVDKNHNP